MACMLSRQFESMCLTVSTRYRTGQTQRTWGSPVFKTEGSLQTKQVEGFSQRTLTSNRKPCADALSSVASQPTNSTLSALKRVVNILHVLLIKARGFDIQEDLKYNDISFFKKYLSV